MYNIPFDITIIYNREIDQEKDYSKTITVMASSRESALKMANDYEVERLFDNVEDDYIENSLYAI